MTDEEIQALLAENKKLRTEVTALQEQVTQLTSQLQAAVAQIAERNVSMILRHFFA